MISLSRAVWGLVYIDGGRGIIMQILYFEVLGRKAALETIVSYLLISFRLVQK